MCNEINALDFSPLGIILYPLYWPSSHEVWLHILIVQSRMIIHPVIILYNLFVVIDVPDSDTYDAVACYAPCSTAVFGILCCLVKLVIPEASYSLTMSSTRRL